MPSRLEAVKLTTNPWLVAKQLDVQVRTRPEAGKRVVPDIDRVVAAGPELPNGAVPISVEARKPLDRPLWFKIFGAGGEVLMQDGQLVFRPYRPGCQELTVFAINENGGVAEETISLGGSGSAQPRTREYDMDAHEQLPVGHRHQETKSRLRCGKNDLVARSRRSEIT